MFTFLSITKSYYKYHSLWLKGGRKQKKAKRLMLLTNIICSCDIPVETTIGKDVHFGHRGLGIVIHRNAIIGDRVHILQNVTIGGKNGTFPDIGNDVLIGAGAVILGDVKVGNAAVIGANALVLEDVPAGAVVGGIPAKRIK